MTRPNFNDIQSFDEFKQYYWYRDELKQICKEHGITHTGTKLQKHLILSSPQIWQLH